MLSLLVSEGVCSLYAAQLPQPARLSSTRITEACVEAMFSGANKAAIDLQGDETFKRQLTAADASRLHTVVDNKLGVPARMELDFGEHM